MGDAQPVLSYRRDLPNGDIIQVVVWLLSEPLPGSPHPYKYRLHYQKVDTSDFIRYDNERCKGDHWHIGGIEEPYCFESVKNWHWIATLPSSRPAQQEVSNEQRFQGED